MTAEDKRMRFAGAREELRLATNAYRRALRFANSCASMQREAAEAVVAVKRMEMSRARNSYRGL